MTANQIAYVKSQEEKRHNYAMEVENNRSNVAREMENSRANTLNYQLGVYRAQSDYNASIYASQASMYNAQLNAQVQRERTEIERISKQRELSLQELRNARDYEVSVGKMVEERRHNRANEAISWYNADTNRQLGIGRALVDAVTGGVALGGAMRTAAR